MEFHSYESGSLSETFGRLISKAMPAPSVDEHRELVQNYLSHLLVKFVHTDEIFAIRDKDGRQVLSVAEMAVHGDIRQEADSFQREREVHRHIGDFILFWSGVYPEFLRQLKLRFGSDLLCDYQRQGAESYYVVSTHDYKPFDAEAPLFTELSSKFEDYSEALGRVGRELRRMN